MREAWERTEYERKKENKKRVKNGNFIFLKKILGLAQLPDETFEDQYRDLCKKLFEEIEEKKSHYKRLEEASKKRWKDELEAKRLKDHYRMLTEDEWESTRGERVSSWKKWSETKKSSNMVGTKKSSGFLRPPAHKMEERSKDNPANREVESVKRLW